MVIELSGVHFGLKSYAGFQNQMNERSKSEDQMENTKIKRPNGLPIEDFVT